MVGARRTRVSCACRCEETHTSLQIQRVTPGHTEFISDNLNVYLKNVLALF